MARRVLLCLVLALLVTAPAGADDIVGKKHSVDAQIAALNDKVAAARKREDALRSQIESASTQIRTLELQVGDVSRRLVPLEHELQLRELKLNRLDALFRVQTERYRFLRQQYAIALHRLNQRLVAIYESNEPDTLAVLLSASSFSDLLDAFDYVRRIGDQDKSIADSVREAKHEVKVARARTKIARNRMRHQAQIVALRVSQVKALRAQILASHSRLTGARAQQRESLASLTEQERKEAEEMDALQAESAQLEAQIRAAQAPPPGGSSGTGAPSAAGLIWPVNGPVTSPFGMRWGRMHTGIDIGVPSGTPIHAAASGTVIIAGVVSGYGNLVFIDHGNGLSTGYAHQSQIAVSVGQSVTQGQVIGYVGCTGHCFGPHLHFEVRVNGAPVDPLGYLP